MACCKKKKQMLALRKKREARMKELNQIKKERMKEKARKNDNKE